MNTLFSYPIIIPSYKTYGNITPGIVWAILIVINAIGLIAFISALLINWYRNKNRKHYREKLWTTIDNYHVLSLLITIILVFDFIALVFALIYWVSTLL